MAFLAEPGPVGVSDRALVYSMRVFVGIGFQFDLIAEPTSPGGQ